MLENIVKGFEEMMNSIMAAFNESYNDKYAAGMRAKNSSC